MGDPLPDVSAGSFGVVAEEAVLVVVATCEAARRPAVKAKERRVARLTWLMARKRVAFKALTYIIADGVLGISVDEARIPGGG
jgi:hypothetical protein